MFLLFIHVDIYLMFYLFIFGVPTLWSAADDGRNRELIWPLPPLPHANAASTWAIYSLFPPHSFSASSFFLGCFPFSTLFSPTQLRTGRTGSSLSVCLDVSDQKMNKVFFPVTQLIFGRRRSGIKISSYKPQFYWFNKWTSKETVCIYFFIYVLNIWDKPCGRCIGCAPPFALHPLELFPHQNPPHKFISFLLF